MTHDRLVHVIDDDEAVRDSISFLLQSSRFGVRSYASASEFLDQFDRAATGCIVTDVRMPDIDGIELLRRISDRQMEIPVIVITGHGDVALALEAMKAGAADFIEKPFEHEVLLGAVRAALSEAEVDDEQKFQTNGKLATLSPVEQQVLQGLTAGKPNNEIASALQIGTPQVEIHRASIMTKMQARGLSHLIRMLLQAGHQLS